MIRQLHDHKSNAKCGDENGAMYWPINPLIYSRQLAKVDKLTSKGLGVGDSPLNPYGSQKEWLSGKLIASGLITHFAPLKVEQNLGATNGYA